MIDYKKDLVTILQETDLPVYYELFIDKTPTIPCITYIEDDNASLLEGTTLSYSEIVYRIKIWAKDIKTISETAVTLDGLLTPIGFKRTNSIELSNNGIIQKITKYSAKALETR